MTVELHHNEVRISSFATSDPVIVAAFRAAEESGKAPEDFLEKILGLGAQVASLSSNTVGAEKIEASIAEAQRAIGSVAGQLNDSIAQQVKGFASEDGSLAKAFGGIIDDFRKELDELTADEHSPMRTAIMASLTEAQKRIEVSIAETQKRIESNVETSAKRQQEALATMLDPLSPTSPLRPLALRLDEVTKSIGEVKESQTKDLAKVEALESGVFGGMEYEDVVVKQLQQIAALAGDDCEATGNSTGLLPRNKMGDAVVDLKMGASVFGRLVMEAKNKKLTKKEWETERDGSLKNRGAQGFIGLCKNIQDMPNGGRILILNAKSMVLAFNPEVDDAQLLFLVYNMVKLATLNDSSAGEDLNIAEINFRLEEALRAVERFDAITKAAATIKNQADKIYDEAKVIQASINQHLAEAKSAMMPRLPAATTIEADELDEGLHALDGASPDEQ